MVQTPPHMHQVWFVWSKTSYSGDKWRCHRCGTDKQTTSKDRATQLLICEPLSFAIIQTNYQTVRESANHMLLHNFLPIQLDQQPSVNGDIKIGKNHNFHAERISLLHAIFSLLIDEWSVNPIVQYSKKIQVKNCIELIDQMAQCIFSYQQCA